MTDEEIKARYAEIQQRERDEQQVALAAARAPVVALVNSNEFKALMPMVSDAQKVNTTNPHLQYMLNMMNVLARDFAN